MTFTTRHHAYEFGWDTTPATRGWTVAAMVAAGEDDRAHRDTRRHGHSLWCPQPDHTTCHDRRGVMPWLRLMYRGPLNVDNIPGGVSDAVSAAGYSVHILTASPDYARSALVIEVVAVPETLAATDTPPGPVPGVDLIEREWLQ